MKKLAIFDMDGTILNTLDDIADSLNYSLEHFSLPTHSIDEIKYYVGNGLHKTVERALPPNSSNELIESVYNFFVPYYKSHCNIKTKPYDGIIELIQALKKMGITTAVISNKNNEAVKDLCNRLFPACFDYSLGDTPGIKLKPDREMVDITLNQLNILPQDSIYIGDSDVDLLTAANSNMECIAVSWGFRGRDFLEAHGAKIIIDTPSEILNYFILSSTTL